MQILVVSDSHGNKENLERIILSNSKSEIVIHLGDGVKDIESIKFSFPCKTFYSVKGNCDFSPSYPLNDTLTLKGKKIFFTHGHNYYVKQGLLQLSLAGKEKSADVILYGHTHYADIKKDGNILIINPGTVGGKSAPPSYALLDISENHVKAEIIRFR